MTHFQLFDPFGEIEYVEISTDLSRALVKFYKHRDAKQSVKKMNNMSLKEGRKLKVSLLDDNDTAGFGIGDDDGRNMAIKS